MQMNDVEIRTVKKEDIPQLLELMYQYIVDFYKRPRPREDDLKALVNHLIDYPSSGLQFVAEKQGTLIGFATLYFTFSTTRVKKIAIMNDLFVVPGARAKGLGQKLFQTCQSYAEEHGFAQMIWETAKDNAIAHSLYEKMGGKQSEWVHYELTTVK